MKFIPIAITIMGLLFCLATYLGAFGTGSPSVIAENQYFTMFLCIPIGGAFVGCLVGMLFMKMLEKIKGNSQRKIWESGISFMLMPLSHSSFDSLFTLSAIPEIPCGYE